MNSSFLTKHWRWWLLFAAAALAYSGMLFEYGARLWAKDYFRFYPVYVIAVLYLTFSRSQEDEWPERFTWRIQPLTLGLGLLSLAASTWFWSPLLAAVSLLLTGDSLLSSLPNARRSWRLLFLLIALPLGMDERLVLELRLASSSAASLLLDRIDVPHVARGNVLQLPGRQLFVEDACSGISSVYLLLASTALVVVGARMRMVRAVPLLASAVWWAGVANVLRIVAIVLADHFLKIDLTTGWQHEAVGIGVLLLALLGIGSTWCFLNLLTSAVNNDKVDAQSGSLNLTPAILWNVITTENQAILQGLQSNGFSVRTSRSFLLTALTLLMLVYGHIYWLAVARASGLLTQSSPSVSDRSVPSTESPVELNSFDQNSFAQLPEISVTDFQRSLVSAADSSRSVHAVKWSLTTSQGPCRVTLSGPFSGWNDVSSSYRAAGFGLQYSEVDFVPGQVPLKALMSSQLSNPEGIYSDVHFCFVSHTGDLKTAHVADTGTGLRDQIAARLEQNLAPDRTGVWWCLELSSEHHTAVLESEFRGRKQLFGDLLKVIVRQWKTDQRRSGETSAAPVADEFPQTDPGQVQQEATQ
ncbi:MAG: exosortase U [Planctomycetaceae bacterium]